MPEINPWAIRQIGRSSKTFISLALVNEIIIDDDEVMLKVVLQPTGEKPLVRMSWDYVGNAFGMYVLPEKDDEILCAFPNGDINRGVCIKRLNNGIDRLPSGKVEEDKILLITKQGHKIDIDVTQGDVKIHIKGNVDLDVEGLVDIGVQGNVLMNVSGDTTINSSTITITTG